MDRKQADLRDQAVARKTNGDPQLADTEPNERSDEGHYFTRRELSPKGFPMGPAASLSCDDSLGTGPPDEITRVTFYNFRIDLNFLI